MGQNGPALIIFRAHERNIASLMDGPFYPTGPIPLPLTIIHFSSCISQQPRIAARRVTGSPAASGHARYFTCFFYFYFGIKKKNCSSELMQRKTALTALRHAEILVTRRRVAQIHCSRGHAKHIHFL